MTGRAMTGGRGELVFSVDVEDWGQSVFDRSLPIGQSCADNVLRLLDLLGRQPDARATFFVLGKFAVHHPDVVRRIARAGHEIGTHGFGHVPIHELSREDFRVDLRRSLEVLSEIVARRVTSFRAPQFSVRKDTLWAFEVLAEEGIELDSSVFPFWGRRYGIGDWTTHPCRVQTQAGVDVVEYPQTVFRVGRRRVPVGGGGYARLWPAWLLVWAMRREGARRDQPCVFYCHPYELDADELVRRDPAPTWGDRRIPLRMRLHQGIGRRGFAGKVRALMRAFRFQSFAQVRARLGSLPPVALGDARWPVMPGEGKASGAPLCPQPSVAR